MLSDQQRDVLCAILEGYDRMADAGEVEPWGVPWHSRGHTAAERASRSRTLRQLEERGLVVRQNRVSGPYRQGPEDPFPGRTTHVTPTERARQCVEELCR